MKRATIVTWNKAQFGRTVLANFLQAEKKALSGEGETVPAANAIHNANAINFSDSGVRHFAEVTLPSIQKSPLIPPDYCVRGKNASKRSGGPTKKLGRTLPPKRSENVSAQP